MMEFIGGSLERSKGSNRASRSKHFKPSVQTLSSVGPLDLNVLTGGEMVERFERGQR
jgi:hypothetical protein